MFGPRSVSYFDAIQTFHCDFYHKRVIIDKQLTQCVFVVVYREIGNTRCVIYVVARDLHDNIYIQRMSLICQRTTQTH